jgi:hypothetical protein
MRYAAIRTPCERGLKGASIIVARNCHELKRTAKTVWIDAMVYNELTDVDATPARAAARLNRQLLGAAGGPNGGQKMAVTTLTSREFNQDTSGAKKAGRRGPVAPGNSRPSTN